MRKVSAEKAAVIWIRVIDTNRGIQFVLEMYMQQGKKMKVVRIAY